MKFTLLTTSLLVLIANCGFAQTGETTKIILNEEVVQPQEVTPVYQPVTEEEKKAEALKIRELNVQITDMKMQLLALGIKNLPGYPGSQDSFSLKAYLDKLIALKVEGNKKP